MDHLCISSDTSWTPNGFLFESNETNIFGRWIKGLAEWCNISLKRWERPKKKEEEKRYFFLERTWTFCNKRCLWCFPEVFCFCGRRNKGGISCSKSKRPHRIRVPTLPKKTREAICRWRKALPYLGKEKNFLFSKRRYLCFSFFCWTNHKKRNLPSAPKKCGKTKEENPKGTKTTWLWNQNAGDLIASRYRCPPRKRKEKYIITAIDLFLILLLPSYSRPTSKNAVDLLRRMHIALGVPMKAVNTDNGGEFFFILKRLAKRKKSNTSSLSWEPQRWMPLPERFNRTLQEEATFLFSELIEVWNRFLSHYLMQYNFFRPHHSLNTKPL